MTLLTQASDQNTYHFKLHCTGRNMCVSMWKQRKSIKTSHSLRNCPMNRPEYTHTQPFIPFQIDSSSGFLSLMLQTVQPRKKNFSSCHITNIVVHIKWVSNWLFMCVCISLSNNIIFIQARGLAILLLFGSPINANKTISNGWKNETTRSQNSIARP